LSNHIDTVLYSKPKDVFISDERLKEKLLYENPAE
jgi:hypothetical protein